ncbi:MAG TPA: YdcF family protein [Vicinamibacterales bacterium]|nr:YdcF family protein [Vicinamibacterales bacterium]
MAGRMYFLNKFLPLFFLPLGVSLILLTLGLARRRRSLACGGLVVLFISSNPLVGHFLMRSTEGWAERRPVAEVPAADAVVVLSPGRTFAPGPAQISESNDANRFFAGTDLALAGKAPVLVFTGAAISSSPIRPTEGDVLAAQARALGVPADRVLVTPLVGNTADEAREVAALLRTRQLQRPRIVLVTSAFHMRRARQLFQQEGVDVEPFPVSFVSSDMGAVSVFWFLPSVNALSKTQTALRELYGRAFYGLRGAIASR